MYEVLRFIEHGGHCRQSIDCIRGTLLIRYLKDVPGIGKAELFGWFRQICVCIDQYHRCRNWKEYRYLNPYSLIVSEEGELLLLDLEAPENVSVMKQMQKRGVRNHFVKPVCEIKAGGEQKADLFAYGRTIQFILAYTDVIPALTRREEARLARIISRCMGESGRAYGDIACVLKDLPVVREKQGEAEWGLFGSRRRKLLAGACACAAVCAILTLAEDGTDAAGDRVSRSGAAVGGMRTAAALMTGMADIADRSARTAADGSKIENRLEDGDILEAVENMLGEYARSDSETERQTALEVGEEMELAVVRCLAEVYEKLGMTEKAADAYGRLIQIEDKADQIEAAGLRKMELEAGQGRFAQAVKTGELVLERCGISQEVSRLIEEYRLGAEDLGGVPLSDGYNGDLTDEESAETTGAAESAGEMEKGATAIQENEPWENTP